MALVTEPKLKLYLDNLILNYFRNKCAWDDPLVFIPIIPVFFMTGFVIPVRTVDEQDSKVDDIKVGDRAT